MNDHQNVTCLYLGSCLGDFPFDLKEREVDAMWIKSLMYEVALPIDGSKR